MDEEKQTGKTGSFFTKIVLSPITIPIVIVLIAVLATVLFWGYNAETFKKADTKVKEVVKSVTGSEELTSLAEIVDDGEGGYCYQLNSDYVAQIEEELEREDLGLEDLGISDYETLETFFVAELATQLPNLNGTIQTTNFSATSYFWPVGSAEPNASGYYIGDPVTVNITSKFGPRNISVPGASKDHKGLDIGANEGTPVIASREGTVSNITYDNARGYYIDIDHGNGITTRYQHLQNDSAVVSVGDVVKQGQLIAYSGSTGVGEAHLHFEVLENGVPVDPLEYVDPENPRPQNSGILENAKQLCMELQDNGFSYRSTGEVNYQFPIDLQNGINGQKVISCSSFVQEVLLRSGYTDLAGGERLWSTKSSLDALAQIYGWEIITDINQLQPGDIFLENPVHVCIYAGDFNFYGSDEFTYAEYGEPVYRPDRSDLFTCAYRVKNATFTNSTGSISDNVYEDGKFQGTVTIQRSSTSKTVETEYLSNKEDEENSIEISNEEDSENADEQAEDNPEEQQDSNEDETQDKVVFDSLEGCLVIGDSFMVALKNEGYLDGAYVHAVVGKHAKYWLEHFDEITEESPKAIIVLLGVNNITDINSMEQLLDKLREKYDASIPINVLKVFPVGSNYKYVDLNTMMNNIKTYNETIEAYCQSKGYNFIDATEGLVDSNGYLSPADSEGIHIKGKNDVFYNNILNNLSGTVDAEKNLSITGITGGGRNLKYLPSDQFDSMLTDTSKDRLGYFTIDDDGKIIVANWEAENDQFTYFRSNAIDYVSKIEKYTMPYQLLIAVQLNLQDEDFSISLANLALQTVSILSIQDNTTTTYTKNKYTQNTQPTMYIYSAKTNKLQRTYSEPGSTEVTGEEESSKQTNSISSQVTKIDGWCAHFEREYSLNQSDSGYNQGQTTTVGVDRSNVIIDQNDEIIARRVTVVTRYKTVYTRTVTRNFSMGKTVTTGNEEKFVGIINANKEIKSKLTQTPEMFIELLTLSDSTSDMVDLMKYLIYKATGKDLGVTEFDFTEFDLTKFNQVGNGGVNILQDYLSSWENSSLWHYLRDDGKYTYNSTPYIYECITEDRKYFLCHADGLSKSTGNRNFGFGVMHRSNDYVYNNQALYANYGIDIASGAYDAIGSQLDVTIVQNVKRDFLNNATNSIKQTIEANGIELEENQIHALVCVKYQYGNIGNFVTVYQQYGNTEALRNNFVVNGCLPFLTGYGGAVNRAEANWGVFHEGIYKTGDGEILDPNSYKVGTASTEVIGSGSVTGPLDAVPTYSAYTSSAFGYRNHPDGTGVKFHYGEDIPAPEGTPIAALGNGTIVEMSYHNARGFYVRIDHGNGYSTLYQHCNGFAEGLQVGDTVTAGQLIAYVGNTGASYGAHLHLEVWVPRGEGEHSNWADGTTDVANPSTFDYSLINSN